MMINEGKYIDFSEDYRNGEHLSDLMQTGLENYLCHGLNPGGFLTAVLANEMYTAVAKADFWNKTRLCYIVGWITTNAPSESYGSYERVKNWIADIDGIRSEYFDKLSKAKMWAILKDEA